MPDETTVVNTEATSTAPNPDDAVDSQGVPWKNRVAEHQRKAEEAEGRATAQAQAAARLNEENERYKVALGQRRQEEPQPRANVNESLDQMEKTFPAETQQYLRALRGWVQEESRKTAETTGYGLITDVSHQSVLQQDKEIAEEAGRQMQALNNHPLWATADERLKRDRAIEGARSVVTARRGEVATKKAMEDAERARAESASLPRTSRGSPPPSADEKAKWIAEWKNSPEQEKMFPLFCRGKGYSTDSPEAAKLFNEAAEAAWEGSNFGGSTAVAIEVMSGRIRQRGSE